MLANYALKPRHMKSTQNSGPSVLQHGVDILYHLLSRLQNSSALLLFSFVDVVRLVMELVHIQVREKSKIIAFVKVYLSS